MVSHGVFAGGPVRNKPAKDAVQRLRGGKNVCSYLCCHTRASGPTPELLMPLQRQSNILLTILQSWSCSKCNHIFGNDAITAELNRDTLQNCNMWVKVWCIFVYLTYMVINVQNIRSSLCWTFLYFSGVFPQRSRTEILMVDHRLKANSFLGWVVKMQSGTIWEYGEKKQIRSFIFSFWSKLFSLLCFWLKNRWEKILFWIIEVSSYFPILPLKGFRHTRIPRSFNWTVFPHNMSGNN